MFGDEGCGYRVDKSDLVVRGGDLALEVEHLAELLERKRLCSGHWFLKYGPGIGVEGNGLGIWLPGFGVWGSDSAGGPGIQV